MAHEIHSAGTYHLHTTGRLWWCRPLARESRSTSQFVTAPRFCSCCSSDAAPPPRRCLFGHGALLEKSQERWNNQKGFNQHLIYTPTPPPWIESLKNISLGSPSSALYPSHQEKITRNSRLPISLIGAFHYRGFNFPLFICVYSFYSFILFEWLKVSVGECWFSSALNLTNFLLRNEMGIIPI